MANTRHIRLIGYEHPRAKAALNPGVFSGRPGHTPGEMRATAKDVQRPEPPARVYAVAMNPSDGSASIRLDIGFCVDRLRL